MQLTCTHSNVVFLFNYNVFDNFNLTEVEEKLRETLSGESEIALTTIPNQIKVVFAQTKNIQVASQQNSLIVSDQNLNETNTAGNDFLRTAHEVVKLFTQFGLKTFGYNFQFSIVPDNFSELQDSLKDKFYKDEVLNSSDQEAIFTLPNVGYLKNGAIYMIAFTAALDDENRPVKVNVSSSVTHEPEIATLGTLAAFKAKYNAAYREVYEYIEGVL